MIKPKKLQIGDTIATISPSWGCAGDSEINWQYQLGVQRLKELGLNVVTAPNSLKGSTFLKNSPEARAEDLMWAFESKSVKAIIANIGGNDCNKILPFIDKTSISENPKIFCGYSDIMALHLYCYQLGLSTFYGDNLLTNIAETKMWHPYSKYWFEKVLFNNTVIGKIKPSYDWSFDQNNYTDSSYAKEYIKNDGYIKVQGQGVVRGRLFGGHGGMFECGTQLNKWNFENKMLFFEDIPEFFTVEYTKRFFDKLGDMGYLQVLNGVIIGKMRSKNSFEPLADAIRSIVSHKYGLYDLPVMYGLNFGHTSPICVLPYDALAELDIDNSTFSILESGVI